MSDSDLKTERVHDMDLETIEAANFEVMVAEEAILDWLVELDTSAEESSEDHASEPARMAN